MDARVWTAVAARVTVAAAMVVGLIAVGGCITVQTTGAASVQDLQAENLYRAVYGEQMSRIRTDNLLFQATAANPGVCNKGGTKQGCFDADVVLIRDLTAMQSALAGVVVPPRYADADRMLKDAIAEDVRGLELRNKAIAEGDDAAWTEHKVALDRAIAGLTAAYSAFPADNRPAPAP